MTTRFRLAPACVAAVILCQSPLPAEAQPRAAAMRTAPDFDIRDRRTISPDSPRAAQAARDLRAQRPGAVVRYDGRTRVRTLQSPSGLTGPDRRAPIEVAQNFLRSADSALLDLDPIDLDTLRPREEGDALAPKRRIISFDQFVEGIPVFDAAVAVHLAKDGRVVRVVSSAAPTRDRLRGGIVSAEEAVRLAAGNIRAELDSFRPTALERIDGPEQRTRMARGPFAVEPIASLGYFPMDGQLRSAWRVVVQPEGVAQPYAIIVDARTGRILHRRALAARSALRASTS
jgi:hypothetical protein